MPIRQKPIAKNKQDSVAGESAPRPRKRARGQKLMSPQSFRNGEIHDWYRIVLGYSDHLVADLLDELGLAKGDRVLDPFSGSGTTAVECKKRGIDCWAVDANPSSCFAIEVKTTWGLRAGDLIACATLIAERFARIRSKNKILEQDPTYRYVEDSGMLKRAWIGSRRLRDAIAIKHAIRDSGASRNVLRALQLGLTHTFVHIASNVRFGPELYCGKPRKGVSVINEFLGRVAQMESDLDAARGCPSGKVRVVLGDSRALDHKNLKLGRKKFDALITSPPYPTEHDYTRNSRLELALLDFVNNRDTVRKIKKGMMRSHTKGIYSTDCDAEEVSRLSRITNLTKRIERKAKSKKYGFARLYGKVTNEYFGGMRRHFRAVFPLLKPGARCAYVVGDQASYFRVKISTASILGEIARCEGFSVESIRIWRRRWASTTSKLMSEHILMLRKPRRRARP